MDLGLIGKKAWVTGASQGLGLAIAQGLWREGASLVLSSRSESKLEKAKQLIARENGEGNIELLPLDMLSPASIAAAGAKIGPVDILIINTGGPAAGEALDITLEDWDQGYQALLRSTIQLTQLVMPGMRAKKWGRILTITSTSARELIPRLPVSGVFRAGLTSWVKSVAKEVGRDNVLINNLLPGATNTARLTELQHSSPDFYHSMKERSALGRLGEPEEIGHLAAFLCSTKNSFITGTDVLADGGSTSSL